MQARGCSQKKKWGSSVYDFGGRGLESQARKSEGSTDGPIVFCVRVIGAEMGAERVE
jgi:hypothetical protein